MEPDLAPFSADPAQLSRWNGRYDIDGYLFGTSPNQFLARQRERIVPGMRTLSVADGEGRNSVWLAQQGCSVAAFDFSPVAVGKARALAAQAGVRVDYHVSDIFRWSWARDAYDLIAVIFIQFLAPDERSAIFARIVESLAPGGLLLLEGYRPEQLIYKTGGPSQVENLYTEALLRDEFAALEILDLAAYDAAVDEGRGHTGMSALIDLVARKSG
jgi:SAM-dependent methyltransferase